LTEAYGCARAHRVTWTGFAALIFYPLAFWGRAGWPIKLIWQVVLSQGTIKTAWEALLTLVPYLAKAALRIAEGIDTFDKDTDLSSFARR